MGKYLEVRYRFASGAVRWQGRMREDSADADLYKLLFRDLSTGGVIRQHRETDYYRNFFSKPGREADVGFKRRPKTLASAFDEDDQDAATVSADRARQRQLIAANR